jgi:hypothetical protein
MAAFENKNIPHLTVFKEIHARLERWNNGVDE